MSRFFQTALSRRSRNFLKGLLAQGEGEMKAIKTLALAFCLLAFVGSVDAQRRSVDVTFEVDGKEVDQEFRILLYVDNKVIEPTRVGKSFVVPPELKDHEKVHVRFLSGKYDLSFDPVYAPKFETRWVVGIDNPPFDSENTDAEDPPEKRKRLLVIWYIVFAPSDGDGTRLVVKVYK